jgi:hypothetical protein
MNDKKRLEEHDDNDDDFEVIELDENQDDDDDDRLESEQRDALDDGGSGGEDNLRQTRRKRQKQRQKDNMRKTREENTILLRELAEAKERLAALESRNVQSDANSADWHYNQAVNAVQVAEAQLKEAFETGDGDKALRAQRMREQSIQTAREAEELKRRLTDPKMRENKPTLDARTERLAQQWVQENPWFDPAGKDEDSVVARAVDEAWAEEARQRGIPPSSEEYWDELDVRVKRRFDGAADRNRRKGPPPVTGRGEYSPRAGASREQFYLSPERKKALMEANLYDDPATRKRYIQKFAEYDRQNKA